MDSGGSPDSGRCRHREDGTGTCVRQCIPGPHGQDPIRALQRFYADDCRGHDIASPVCDISSVTEAFESQGLAFNNNREMPYMDSFMKESARLGPSVIDWKLIRSPTIVSVPRRVMSPYISPDGVNVPTGNWVAVPQLPLMRDPKLWSGGSAFNGFRFVDSDGSSSSRFTHPSLDFPYWGSVRHAW
ncbi:hypothetical protein Q9189_006682 [Teloschistes chrysophthalmus]